MKNLILITAVVSTLIIAACGGEKKPGNASTLDSMTAKPKVGTIDSMTVTKTTSGTIDSMTVKAK
jgi:ABC-type glycerol-3-phosphate transport system substrate-binding protein